jgi:hypothetical protein
MKDWLPEGYELNEVPPDYSLPLFLEYQMGYAFEQGRDSLTEEIKRLKAEVEQYKQEWIDCSIKLENLNAP